MLTIAAAFPRVRDSLPERQVYAVFFPRRGVT